LDLPPPCGLESAFQNRDEIDYHGFIGVVFHVVAFLVVDR
jgi:hypothetical protein